MQRHQLQVIRSLCEENEKESERNLGRKQKFMLLSFSNAIGFHFILTF